MYKVVVPALLLLSSSASAHHLQTTEDGARTLGWCEKTIEFSVDQATETKLGAAGMAAMRRAGSAWLGLEGVPVISIVSERDADVGARGTIEWLPEWNRPDSHIAVADVDYFPSSGALIHASIFINGQESWSLDASGMDGWEYDLESTMVHEFGHALGLDHLNRDNSVMQEAAKRGTLRLEPSDDDMDALEASYAIDRACKRSVHEQVQEVPSCSATGVRDATGGKRPAPMMMCAVMLAFLYRLFQRSKTK